MFRKKNEQPPSPPPLPAPAPSQQELDPRLVQILKEADFVKTHLAGKMGISLEYNYCCMLQIDLLIDRLLNGQASEDPERLARIFGSYFGECVRRTFSGSWVFTEDRGAIVKGLGGTDIDVFPYNTLRSRICDNEEGKVFATSCFIASKLAKTYSDTIYKKDAESGPRE